MATEYFTFFLVSVRLISHLSDETVRSWHQTDDPLHLLGHVPNTGKCHALDVTIFSRGF